MRTDLTITQAGQAEAHGVKLSVINTVAENTGPVCELSIATASDTPCEATLGVGNTLRTPTGTEITLLAMEASTRSRRGWVRLAVDSMGDDVADSAEASA